MKLIDASNQILGRLSSAAAKDLLNGEEIVIINAEKCVLSGNPEYNYKLYKEKVERGNLHTGPFFPKRPDRILKRTIRGMIARKKARGREAFKNLKVFVSVPDEYEKMKPEQYKKAENKLTSKFTTLDTLSKKLGANVTW